MNESIEKLISCNFKHIMYLNASRYRTDCTFSLFSLPFHSSFSSWKDQISSLQLQSWSLCLLWLERGRKFKRVTFQYLRKHFETILVNLSMRYSSDMCRWEALNLNRYDAKVAETLHGYNAKVYTIPIYFVIKCKAYMFYWQIQPSKKISQMILFFLQSVYMK